MYSMYLQSIVELFMWFCFPLKTRINSHICTHWAFYLWLRHPVSETYSLHSQKEIFSLHPPTQIEILTRQYMFANSAVNTTSNVSETVFLGR